jgi:hypothetical protein
MYFHVSNCCPFLQCRTHVHVSNEPMNVSFILCGKLTTVKIRLQKRSNVIIPRVCNQTELYQELEID